MLLIHATFHAWLHWACKHADRREAAHLTVQLCGQLDKCAALLHILMTPVDDTAMTSQDSFSCHLQALLLSSLPA